MTLSNEDREALMEACPVAIASYVGDHDDLFALVEQIVARHVAAALNAAADELDRRASGGTALNFAARIVRTAANP